MTDRIRSSIELYDGRQGGKRLFWRLSAMLYHANSGDPETFRTELEAQVAEAMMALKSSRVRYWYNGVRLAGTMVARSVDGQKLPRLLPCVALPTTSDYLYRVFLAPDEEVTVTCHRVVHDDGGLIESLSKVDEKESQS